MVFDQQFGKYPLLSESSKHLDPCEYKIKSKLFYFHHRQHRKLSAVSYNDVIFSLYNEKSKLHHQTKDAEISTYTVAVIATSIAAQCKRIRENNVKYQETVQY